MALHSGFPDVLDWFGLAAGLFGLAAILWIIRTLIWITVYNACRTALHDDRAAPQFAPKPDDRP